VSLHLHCTRVVLYCSPDRLLGVLHRLHHSSNGLCTCDGMLHPRQLKLESVALCLRGLFLGRPRHCQHRTQSQMHPWPAPARLAKPVSSGL
jgi:hypothetical protein